MLCHINAFARRRSMSMRIATLCGLLFLVCLSTTSVNTDHNTVISAGDNSVSYHLDRDNYLKGRRLLEEPLNCTPRSINQFPQDVLTTEQRRHGGVILHILVALYIFAALAIVCDDYFVPALEQICEALHLQPDVAGATFMAAGSSAPELFTAIIGTFFAKSDVGVGTIVGSAVFNILVIVGICAIFGGMIIYLTWWPMCRDLAYYTVTVAILVAVMSDEKVHWYEALIMMLVYVFYCVIMYFNPRIGNFCMAKFDQLNICSNTPKSGETTPLLASQGHSQSSTAVGEQQEDRAEEHNSLCVSTQSSHRTELFHSSNRFLSARLAQSDQYMSPVEFPTDLPSRIRWIIMFPASSVFYITIPDCRRPGCWRKAYAATFILSIIWIAVMSFLMVWMVTIIGDTFGIPDTIMGLTLLAAGTSIPDALSSLFAARDGYGDMAVSNSIGSNIFDILLCLGLPWLIQTAMVQPGSVVAISSTGLNFSALTLLATVVFLFLALLVNRWRLTKVLGCACLVAYIIIITFSCLYELGVFGQFSLPPCPI